MLRSLLTLTLGILCVSTSMALSGSQVNITIGSGPYFYSDDGNCGSSEIPRAAYVVINVENTSSSDTLYNIKIKLDSIANTIAGFKLLSFSDDSTYTIPRILPNSTTGGYFYIQYPCTKNLTSAFSFTLSDDNSGSTTFNTTISTKDIGPAGAGGDIVSQVIVGIDALGILIADTVTYDFGNYNGGEMFFQPSGDTLFPVDELELIGSEVLSSAFASCAPKSGDRNILYYNAASGCGGGSGNQVKVVYYYISSLFNDTAVFKPYAGMKSGGPIKYLSNYGVGVARDTFGTTLNANKFTVTKTASCGICTPGDTITYTIKIANSASIDLMFDKILDSLPSGHSYVGFASGSNINQSNTSSYPSTGSTGNIVFSGMIPAATFPYRSYLVTGNSYIELKYKVKIPAASSNDIYQNQAIGQVGNHLIDTSYAVTCAGCSALPITLIYFNGQLVGETVHLEWATSSEVNNKGFDLYRYTSEEEQYWLDFVDGVGNSSVIQMYNYFDLNEIKGSQIYKLEQQDFDGNLKSYFTKVARPDVLVMDKFRAYPNPVTNQLNIELDVEYHDVTIRLVDLLGQVIYTIKAVDQKELTLDLGEIKLGIYFVQVECDGHYQMGFRILKK